MSSFTVCQLVCWSGFAEIPHPASLARPASPKFTNVKVLLTELLATCWAARADRRSCGRSWAACAPRAASTASKDQCQCMLQGLSGVLSYEHMEPFYKRAAAARDRAGDRDGAHELRKKMLRHKQRR